MTASSAAVVCRSPRDLMLAVQIAWFVRRLAPDLARTDVTTFLRAVRRAPSAASRDLAAVRGEAQRIRRIAMAVLSLPRFWQGNTCYVRALTIYRFLDPAGHDVQLHIGIEQRGAERALHGHGWLTLDDTLLEAPDDVVLGMLHELRLDARR
jgi:hypothetical protein